MIDWNWNKHSSLFGLVDSDEIKKFYNIDTCWTSSDASVVAETGDSAVAVGAVDDAVVTVTVVVVVVVVVVVEPAVV